jgi:two-component system, NarL family, sensor histidine kinase UhpB
MTLRFRLNLIVTLILLVILSIGAVITIQNARESVRAEVDSTMDLALHMLEAELSHFKRTGLMGVMDDISPFNLGRLSGVRHLRIEFYDRHGYLVETNQVEDEHDEADPPAWFVNQMHDALENMTVKSLPVLVNGDVIGKLVISPEPSNEISEAWEETKTMLGLIALFFVSVNVVVYIAVGLSLKPIDEVNAALTDIEAGHLDRRLPIFKLPEMASISRKFNGMASALQLSTRNNHRLTQQIIRLQEAERKSIAHELHDEIGQHLTAIHVDASVIKSCTDLESAKQSAVAIDEVVRQMMDIVRTMLHRLRPGGLDEIGFLAAVQDLINSWQERHDNINVFTRIEGDFSSLDENEQLTLYRVLQECLTNISRHAQADRVDITLIEAPKHRLLSVKDNGQGFDTKRHPQRFGLAGMRERVDSIGGKFEITSEYQQGVTVEVTLEKQGEHA